MTRREFAKLAAIAVPTGALLAPKRARAAERVPVTLYKNPQCTCCENYAQYLDRNGFKVDVKPTNDLAEISRKAGIPEDLQGCHTSFVGSYVVDGHVPVKTIRKLLDEKPTIAGITLPGMPPGSPGMYGEETGPLTVYTVSRDGTPPRIFDVD
ncbi:MAG: CopG family transcriptional regulator [Pseudomonadota bacterium]|nr:CopG family transcriptional regulator [Pseudomonadota bacterium]